MPQTSLLTWAGYTFDAVLSETTADAVIIPKHPQESGQKIADTIIHLATPVAAEVVASDIPGDGTAHRAGRANDIYLSLLGEMGNGTVSNLTTGIRSHPDMVLTSVQRTRSAPEAAARMSVTWEPYTTVSSQEVAVPLPHTSVNAAKKVSLGKKATSTPPAATQTRARSIIQQMRGS